ncbi:unnamed protein product [Dovyalis caffra]|uniref:Uncharacterized protein n=1 Tax=Dovyalis caffra TaxID=77055 RepID=A0AAV1RAQ9_9ROSI|nr:unnamed protein product [Dovyalis caffra]
MDVLASVDKEKLGCGLCVLFRGGLGSCGPNVDNEGLVRCELCGGFGVRLGSYWLSRENYDIGCMEDYVLGCVVVDFPWLMEED